MNSYKNSYKFLTTALALSMILTGCSIVPNADSETDTSSLTETVAEAETVAESVTSAPEAAVQTVSDVNIPASLSYSIDPSSLFSDRDLSGAYDVTTTITLSGNSAEISGEGAAFSDGVLTITAEGTYRLTGSFSGQIIVNAEGAKVQLVLDDAHIASHSGSAISVLSAKKVFLTLAEGTDNSVSDDTEYADTSDGAPDAAIYSKESLTINGSGSLTVSGNYQDGIVSKDDLVITGGTVNVTAVSHGIKGKDYVAIAGGTITVKAGGDGIKATNTEDPTKGFVYIGGGEITIDAQQDGIQAETELVIEDGEVNVLSGGGTANAPEHTDSMMGGFGGFGGRDNFDGNSGDFKGRGSRQQDSNAQPEQGTASTAANVITNAINTENTAEDTENSEDTSDSTKALKAGTLLYIGGGSVNAEAADDTLHSNGNLCIAGGSVTLAAGSKGVHADATAEISSGSLNITQSYEGIEAKDISVSGGTVTVTSSDDGFNASDGSNQGAMGGAVDASLTISGGNVYVNANGDGLDSNGDLLISGGIVLVDGPTNSGNGALDSNSSLTCTGGLLIAAGASGIAEYPDGSQETIVLTTTDTQSASTLVTIVDSNGNEILSYMPTKTWNSFIVSSSAFLSGETYTVYLGGSSSEQAVNGLYEVGGYRSNGTESGSVTMDDTVCFIGEAGGMMGGFGGGQKPGGGNFQPGGDFDPSSLPDDFDPSQMPNGGDFDSNNLPDDFDPSQMQLPTDADGNAVQPPQGGPGGMKHQNGSSTNQAQEPSYQADENALSY